MKSSSKKQHLVNDVLKTLDNFSVQSDEPEGLMTQSLYVQNHFAEVEVASHAETLSRNNSTPDSNNMEGNVVKKSASSSGLTLSLSYEPIVSSYNEQWQQLFGHSNEENLLGFLYEQAVRGQLRNCHFRSISWRIFLGVISTDKKSWSAESANWRAHYNDLKAKHLRDPHTDTSPLPTADHPLNNNMSSGWHKHFQGENVKRQIRQDVMRTFPELKFFQDTEVRESLVNVLFCYSETSSIGYKQGMPEVLAPLVFVLHSDSLDLEQARGQNSASSEVFEATRDLLQPEFMEHDAFAMFDRILSVIGRWYEVRETSLAPLDRDKEASFRRPFQPHLGNHDAHCSSVVVHLNDLHSQHLKAHDLELYLHLEHLEIAPQMYGLRWLRLLFGREFPVQDLLIIWDALFAVESSFVLADYLYVALLMEIRDQLLAGDFATCLCLMMRYPPRVDVHHVVATALHLYQPSRFPPPRNYSSPLTTPSHPQKSTTTSKKRRNKTTTGLDATTLAAAAKRTLPKLPSFNRSAAVAKPSVTSAPPTKSTTPPGFSDAASPSSSQAAGGGSSAPQTPCREMIAMVTPEKADAPDVSKHCAVILRTCAARLQEFVDTAEEPLERLESVQLSLADVKQVLYILNGNLKAFAETSSPNDIIPMKDLDRVS